MYGIKSAFYGVHFEMYDVQFRECVLATGLIIETSYFVHLCSVPLVYVYEINIRSMKGAITLKPPVIFWNSLKVTPLDDTPTEARIGGVYHLVKLLWLHPHDRHQEAVVLIGLVLR